MFAALSDDPDLEYLIVDSTTVRVRPSIRAGTYEARAVLRAAAGSNGDTTPPSRASPRRPIVL